MKLIIVKLLLMVMILPAHAVDINPITSFKNVDAWIVESHQLPFVTMDISLRAGSAFEGDKHGLANLTASLLTEGAGRYNAEKFQQELERMGSKITASADKLNINVQATMLTENIEQTLSLLTQVIISPRFDESAVERIKQAIISGLKQGEESPAFKLDRAFDKAIYGEHVYAHPVAGYVDSVEKLTQQDIRDYHQQNFTRANMKISVVGDINPAHLAKIFDKQFLAIPVGEKRNKLTSVPQQPLSATLRVEMDIPQSHIKTGHEGISRHDKDYFAAYVMNYILGGGGFNSRLMEEVRTKRGLAYSVYSYFDALPQQGAFVSSVQTKTKDEQHSLHLIRKEMEKMRSQLVSEEEYQGAINYLTGSFPLRIDSNAKILGYLSIMQSEDLGRDYLKTWTSKIKAVTREDVQRVAQRLLHPERLVTVIAGKIPPTPPIKVKAETKGKKLNERSKLSKPTK